jgi:hypothetical protein
VATKKYYRQGFKLKHIPTRYYYTPSRKIKNLEGVEVKSHLSETGKTYSEIPSFELVRHELCTHLVYGKQQVEIKPCFLDWDIVEISRDGSEKSILHNANRLINANIRV